MTKERMKDLLIVGMLPFLVVAFVTTDWSFLSPLSGLERKCDIVHVNAPTYRHRCEVFESRD